MQKEEVKLENDEKEYENIIDLSKEKQRRENKRKEERSLSKKETSPPKEGKGGLLPGEEYEYESMLDRIYLLLQTNNQDLIMNKKKFINPPHVIKLSGKRSSWINFHEICQMLHRSPEHLLQFVSTELNTTVVFGKNNQLILRGKFYPKHIESVLRHYIKDYVNCKMCKNTSTTLEKDSTTRAYRIHCNACQSFRSVNLIKQGIRTVGRGERRKENELK